MDSDGFTRVTGYLYLPKEGSDPDVFGFRWQVGDQVWARVITQQNYLNSEEKFLMKNAIATSLGFSAALLASVIF